MVDRLLARRPRDDLEPGLQRIVVLDELQFRRAAAEQRGEQLLEVAIDLVEGLGEPLAAFLVEALDAAAQLGDRADQVVAFVDDHGRPAVRPARSASSSARRLTGPMASRSRSSRSSLRWASTSTCAPSPIGEWPRLGQPLAEFAPAGAS
jgi:hypothetical protein